TTGGHPDDPAYDNPTAFADRFRQEQDRDYHDTRGWTDPLRGEGIWTSEKEGLTNTEVGSHVGTEDRRGEVEPAEQRRASLDAVEAAVDSGRPVPITLNAPDGGRHALMIVGHDGDRLQVYNPWGTTTWISEDDYINNHMDKVTQHGSDS